VGLRTDPAWIAGSSDRGEPKATDVPLLIEGAGLFTIFQAVNASERTQTVTLRAIDQSGPPMSGEVRRVLGPNGAIRGRATDIFGLDEASFWMGSVRVEGTEPVTAVSAIGHTLGTSFIVVPDSVLHAHEMVWRTRSEDRSLYDGITLVNRYSTPASVSLSFIRADGTTISRTTLTIPAYEQLTRTLAELLPEALEEGIVVLQSDQPIMGSALTGKGADLLNNLPMQWVPGGANVPAQRQFLAVGTVRTSGAALLGVNIHLTGASAESKVTDSVGTFTFDPINPGAYTLTPQFTGYTFAPATTAFTITDSNSRNNDFEGTLVKPEITMVTPPNVVANSPETKLTITGGPFISTSLAILDGLPLETVLVDAQTLTTTINAVNLTLPRDGSLVVRNSGPAGNLATSDPETFVVGSPAPTITSLMDVPNEVITGSSAFTITVDGTDFVAGTVVQVNESARTTTFVNENTLTTTIPATDLTVAGILKISAIKPSPTVGPSNELFITVLNPIAGLISVTPNTFVARPGENAQPVSLTVVGFNFVDGAVVLLDGTDLPTTYAGSTTLFAQIPGDLIPDGGPRRITPRNPEPVVLRDPPSETLPVMVSNPIPVLESVSLAPTDFDPNRPVRPDGEEQKFNILVVLNGANFNASTKAFFSGGCEEFSVTGNLLNARQLVFEIPITCAGDYLVLIENAQPGGGISTTLDFSVGDTPETIPEPEIVAIAPGAVVAGSAAFDLTIAGNDFSTSSKVVIGTAVLTPTSATANQIIVSVPALLVGAPGILPIVVTHPDAGDSNRKFLLVNFP
jgi:hypothetical protein